MIYGALAALLSSLSFVVSSYAFEYSGKRVGTYALNLLRLIFAFILLAVINHFILRTDASTLIASQDLKYLSLSGLVGFVLGDIFLFQAFITIGTKITLIIKSLTPVISAILGYLLLNESLSIGQVLGMFLVIASILIATLGKTGPAKGPIQVKYSPQGILYACLGALGQAAGLVISKMGLVSTPALLATEIRAGSGILGFIFLFTILGKWGQFRSSLKDLTALKAIALGSAFGPLAGVTLSLVAMTHTTVAVASTLGALSPIFSIPFAFIFFRDRIRPSEVLGASLSVIGIAVMFL